MGMVFVIRHGETAWSAIGRHTGRTDLPLTGVGRRQGGALAELLADTKFALVLTSPLERARVTCELAGLGDQAEIEPDLAEWDYGEYEGISTEEIRKNLPAWSIWTHPPEKGERIESVGARADRVLARIARIEGNVALFGHSHAIRVLTARWLGLEPRMGSGFILETGALGILSHDREFPAIVRWNTASQLRGARTLN